MLVELVETVSAGYERRERFIVTISRSASFSFVEISTKMSTRIDEVDEPMFNERSVSS